MIDIEIPISISERSSGWAINYIPIYAYTSAEFKKRFLGNSNAHRRKARSPGLKSDMIFVKKFTRPAFVG